MKKRLFNLFISLVIFIALLFGVELLLGAISDQTPKRYVPQRHVFLKEHSPGVSKTYDQSLTLFTGGTPNGETRQVRFEIDEKGYIEPSNLLEDPDLRIAFLGGSTTECADVAELKRFPYLVGQLLNKDGLRVNTMNAAVAGNNSAHTLNIYLNKVMAERPDIAVMMHNINDLHELLMSQGYWGADGRPAHIITEKVSLKTAFAVRFKSVFPNMGLRFDNVMWKFRKEPSRVARRLPELTEEDKLGILRQFKENLRIFVSISRIKGVTPVLMTQASRIKTDFVGVERGREIIENRFNMPFQDYKKLYGRMNEAIRELCNDKEVLMIDLDMLASSEHIFDSVHYNDHGSEYVAGHIAQHLAPLAKEILMGVED